MNANWHQCTMSRRDPKCRANGNLTNDGQFVYVWDNADRLKEVRTLDNSLLMSCRYDGLGRRRERIVAAHGVGGPSTNRYVYHEWAVLEVRDGANTVLETYTHGPDLSGTLGGAGGIGGILSCTTSASATAYYHYDGNGNVVRLTDASRSIVPALEYGPFGTVLLKSGPYTPRYQFSSKEFDSAVGLNYYGYRFYSPSLARFINRDPIEERGGLNLYGFLSNDPVNYADILGLASYDGPSEEEGFAYDLSVGECEIAIFYGHGAPGLPHNIDFEGDQCSRGVFFGCGESDTNTRIPEDRRLFPNDPGESGTRGHHDIIDSAMEARDDALAAAGDMCDECKCESVSIQYVFVPHNTWRGRLRDRFLGFGGLDEPFTGANGDQWPGNETINCDN